jgi:tetratricopeptide (TPR) repeat protein
MGDFRLALKEFSRCADLSRTWLQATGDRHASWALAQADERIGTAAQELGMLTDSQRAFDEDRKVLDGLLQGEPRNPRLHRLRAVVEHYRSDLYWSDWSANFGDMPKGLRAAQEYLQRAQAMVRNDPNNASAHMSNAIALSQVSFCLRHSDPQGAMTMALASVRMFDDLIASGKNGYLESSRRLHALVRLGEAQLSAHQNAAAVRTAQAAVSAMRPLVTQAPEADLHHYFVSALLLAGHSSEASGLFEQGEKFFTEARHEAESLAQRREIQNVLPLASVEAALGNFYASRRRKEEARACFRRLADLWEQFPDSSAYVTQQKASTNRLLASLHS